MLTSVVKPMVFGTPTKSADAPASQTGFDALSVLDANTKSAGVDVVRPTFSAHRFLSLRCQGKPMPARGFDQVNGGGIQNGCGMSLRFLQYTDEMLLGAQGCLSTHGLFRRPDASSATQGTTSTQNGKQVAGDGIDGPVAIYAVE